MGTNFYWKQPFGREGEHIGKRSAAGLFCWDCGITLCKNGIPAVHQGEYSWHNACPKCGKKHETKEAKASYLELGFTTPRKKKPEGVESCSSFRWAINPDYVRKIIHRHLFKRVLGEYGKSMSGRKFLKMIDNNCPIQYNDSIGEIFS